MSKSYDCYVDCPIGRRLNEEGYEDYPEAYLDLRALSDINAKSIVEKLGKKTSGQNV